MVLPISPGSLCSRALVLAFLFWCALSCGPASAQYAPAQGFRLDRWVSTPTSRDGFAVTRPSVLEHGVWSAKFVGSYALRPLVLRNPQEHTVVAHRMGAEFTAAIGLWESIELYGRLPVTLFSLGDDVVYQQTAFEAPGGFALSDIALGTTWLLMKSHGFELGGRAELIMPSGNRGQLAGDSALAPRVHGLAEYARGPVALVLNGGFVYRPARDYALARIGQELEWGALIRFDAQHGIEFLLEAFGTRGLRDRAGPSASDSFDLSLGARYSADTGAVRMRSGLSLGTGLSAALGDPDFRSLFSLALEPRPQRPVRVVPKELDSDRDGVHDEHDECPSNREDMDGFEDGDGCPDEDNDGDHVLDGEDRCPLALGDAPRGCPIADSDGDRIPDDRDRCPEDAENLNGSRDQDGCPERDLDGDGLDDDADACPDVAGASQDAGCRAHARFAGDQITLLTPVSFTDATLQDSALPVLDDVAALLLARPLVHAEITVTAEPASLSTLRAQALGAALIARGVPAARVSLKVAAPAPASPAEGVTIHLRASP
jgi:hypothetical protein